MSSKIAHKRKTARREKGSRACLPVSIFSNTSIRLLPHTLPEKPFIVLQCQMWKARIPRPFSLSPYPLPLSTPATKANTSKKMHLIWVSKVLIGDTIFTSPTGDGTVILRGHSSHERRSRHLQSKAVRSFVSYFKTLSIGPAPGIEPVTDPALQSSALPPELILRGVSHAWHVCYTLRTRRQMNDVNVEVNCSNWPIAGCVPGVGVSAWGIREL